jgi:hypothetical protein
MIEVDPRVYYSDGDRGITGGLRPRVEGPNHREMIETIGKDVVWIQDWVWRRKLETRRPASIQRVRNVRVHVAHLRTLSQPILHRGEGRRVLQGEGERRNAISSLPPRLGGTRREHRARRPNPIEKRVGSLLRNRGLQTVNERSRGLIF